MLHQWINAYRNKTFEQKIVIATLFSLFLNMILAIGKIVITIISGSFIFLISAGINACSFLSKMQCYSGIKHNSKGKDFKIKNIFVACLLMLSGLMFVLYMGRLLLFHVKTFQYTEFLGINIALISFIEMGFAITGIIRVKKSGYFYRNIKVINFASACTAIVLTQVAILSFTQLDNANFVNGLTGVGIGFFIILLGIFVLILPKVGIADRIHNEYHYLISYDDTQNRIYEYQGKYNINISNGHMEIIFSNHIVYGKYCFEAVISENGIEGELIHERHFFKSLPIYVKILFVILSEILLIVWLFGRGIDFIKNACLPKKLDRLMSEFHMILVREE